jgi:hypothetical protein
MNKYTQEFRVWAINDTELMQDIDTIFEMVGPLGGVQEGRSALRQLDARKTAREQIAFRLAQEYGDLVLSTIPRTGPKAILGRILEIVEEEGSIDFDLIAHGFVAEEVDAQDAAAW